MTLIIKIIFTLAIIILTISTYSLPHSTRNSNNKDKAFAVIESNINKSASILNINSPSINWDKSSNGEAIANVEYQKNKIKIRFSSEELKSAEQGYIAPATSNKIKKMLVHFPPGGGGFIP